MAIEGDESLHKTPSSEVQPNQSPPRQSSPPPESDEKPIHLKFLLTNPEAGSVIGKGGSTINDIQSQSGARIQLSRNYEYFPGTADRIAMVSGSIDDVLKAVEFIQSKLLDEFYVEDDSENDPESRIRLVVPNSSCGGIIGKAGVIISFWNRSLIEDSQAGIKISPQDNYFPGLHDRIVTVSGTLGAQMRAVELILFKLLEDSYYQQSANTPFAYPAAYNGMNYSRPNRSGVKYQNNRFPNKPLPEDSSSVTIGIADEHIGLVVGRGGRSIMEISQLSGARIKISDRGDFMTGTTDRKVTIMGPEGAIQTAESMILQKVASASES